MKLRIDLRKNRCRTLKLESVSDWSQTCVAAACINKQAFQHALFEVAMLVGLPILILLAVGHADADARVDGRCR